MIVVAAVLLALLAPSAALAADPPGSPGPSYSYGVGIAELGDCGGALAADATSGGWDHRRIASKASPDWVEGGPFVGITNNVKVLQEPCYGDAGSLPTSLAHIRVPFNTYHTPKAPAPPAYLNAYSTIGYAGHTEATDISVRCADTQWSTSYVTKYPTSTSTIEGDPRAGGYAGGVPPQTDAFESKRSQVNLFADVPSGYTCAFIQQIVLKACWWINNGDDPGDYVCEFFTWSAARYGGATPYIPDEGLRGLCDMDPEAPECLLIVDPFAELPIVCELTTAGADIIAVFQNTFASLSRLPGCWFIPVGWDRGHRIERAWESGGTGSFNRALSSAMPDGLTCGSVADLPVFGSTVELNTCAADFAPSWVKNVVGWLIVLGLLVLAVRRILWSVGGGSK